MRAWIKSRMNDWLSRFYDIGGKASDASSGDPDELELGARRVNSLLGEFALLCLPSVLVHPLFKLVINRWVLSWRIALINSYLSEWTPSEHRIENGAQRVSEDTQRFARGVATICMVLLDCVLTLAVFAPILLELGIAIRPTPRPGSWLVLVCVGMAVCGTFISIALGWKLVSLEVENQKVEANLRKRLVLQEERRINTQHLDPNTLVDESPKPGRMALKVAFKHVIQELKDNYIRLYSRFAAFSLWLGAYEQLTVILPYLLVAPLLFAGDNPVSLGKVTQTSHAFGNVFDSLNVLSDRWVEFTEFMSVIRRLREWERMLLESPRAQLMELDAASSTAQRYPQET